MSEEEKAIRWLKETILRFDIDFNIDSEDLHYLIILKNLIKNQQELIKELQEDIDVLTSDDDNDSVWNEEENM